LPPSAQATFAPIPAKAVKTDDRRAQKIKRANLFWLARFRGIW
jgi:hypothetical protein